MARMSKPVIATSRPRVSPPPLPGALLGTAPLAPLLPFASLSPLPDVEPVPLLVPVLEPLLPKDDEEPAPAVAVAVAWAPAVAVA